jgi:hypothetical protein
LKMGQEDAPAPPLSRSRGGCAATLELRLSLGLYAGVDATVATEPLSEARVDMAPLGALESPLLRREGCLLNMGLSGATPGEGGGWAGDRGR